MSFQSLLNRSRSLLLVTLVSLSVMPLAAQEATETPEAPVFPLSITHSLGTIEIPAAPERIIALGSTDIDVAYAVGINPIAIYANPYEEDGISPWLDDYFDAEETELITFDQLNFEQVVELQPDLIMGSVYNIDTLYANLSQIAPTTAWITESYGDTWQEQAVAAGQALGKEAEAQELVDETESQIEAIQTEYPAIEGKTFSLSFLWDTAGIATIYSPDDFAVQFFQELGFELTPALAELEEEEGNSQGALSLETLHLIDADLVVLAFASPEIQTAYEENPLYQQLQAVKDGRVVVVDLTTIALLRTPSVLGIQWVLENLKPSFELLTES